MKEYTFNYNVRLDDLDYMGIVGNSNWLTILERSRIDLLEKIEFPFSKMLEQQIGGVVAEATIKFMSPAFFNDQLAVNILPHSPFSKGLMLQYLVKNQKNIECLKADITIVFVDKSGKSTTMPETIKKALLSNLYVDMPKR